jgi:hypothetical protein
MITNDSEQARGAKGAKRAFKPLNLLVFVATILFIGSVGSWYYHSKTNPERLFWGMIQNNLATSSVTRAVTQDDGQQTLRQIVQIQTSPRHLVNSQSVITQGENEATRVVTESIGTPTTDYVRYKEIRTVQKSVNGKELDFSGVKGVWGKTDPKQDAAGATVTAGQLYNELVLNMIPFANLNPNDRIALVEELKDKKVYKFQQVKVERNQLLARPTATFNVEIAPAQYIAVLKTFGSKVGLTQLKNLDPARYASAQPVAVQVTIDSWSNQLKQMVYMVNGRPDRVERFSAYNSKKHLNDPPTQTISIAESKLQSIQ